MPSGSSRLVCFPDLDILFLVDGPDDNHRDGHHDCDSLT
jgi:hypothetical protein